MTALEELDISVTILFFFLLAYDCSLTSQINKLQNLEQPHQIHCTAYVVRCMLSVTNRFHQKKPKPLHLRLQLTLGRSVGFLLHPYISRVLKRYLNPCPNFPGIKNSTGTMRCSGRNTDVSSGYVSSQAFLVILHHDTFVL